MRCTGTASCCPAMRVTGHINSTSDGIRRMFSDDLITWHKEALTGMDRTMIGHDASYMIASKFSHWERWAHRDRLPGIHNPGVYALAVSKEDLLGNAFSFLQNIVYFGMTISRGGLKARLRQFDNTIAGKEGHGGGQRVRYKYRDYKKLTSILFVSVFPIACDVQSNKPRDLLQMGEVAYLEYYCFAKYARLYGKLPEFNDKNAPKLRSVRM